VLVIWGGDDWARAAEKDRGRELIPGAQVVDVEGGGHFLPLDRPDAVVA
jgi:pimeloyl-ACP methyl ester carboxylesterase